MVNLFSYVYWSVLSVRVVWCACSVVTHLHVVELKLCLRKEVLKDSVISRRIALGA